MKYGKRVSDCATGFSNSRGSHMSNHFGLHPTNKPVKLYPENMNKPFVKRFLEWWK